MAKDVRDEQVIQNLEDAGCREETVKEFLDLRDEGNVQAQLKLLSQHRKELLDKVHQEERCISCLDYLVYQMEKDDQDS